MLSEWNIILFHGRKELFLRDIVEVISCSHAPGYYKIMYENSLRKVYMLVFQDITFKCGQNIYGKAAR